MPGSEPGAGGCWESGLGDAGRWGQVIQTGIRVSPSRPGVSRNRDQVGPGDRDYWVTGYGLLGPHLTIKAKPGVSAYLHGDVGLLRAIIFSLLNASRHGQ